MATAAGKVRQRAWKPKNRTGCKTCKIRKVKCDEEKPNCNRCTSTGRKCDGYDPNFRPPQSTSPPLSTHLTVYGGHNSSVGNGVIRSPSPSYLAPALRFSTVEERESFDFFTSHAVMSLRGFLDSPFWQREVLQAAHQDQAIRHCVIALGAMHRRFYEGGGSHINEQDMTDAYLQFALRQSNQAIQDLVRKQNSNGKIGKSDKVTLMTCSILFSSMACLQGHQKDALDHLKSGIRMLNEMDDEENDKKVDHAIDMNSLRSIFVGLDMLARSIMPTSQSRSWVTRPKSNAISTLPKAELNMSSLLEMLRYMESLLNNIHSFFQGFDSRPPEEVTNIVLDYSDLIIQFHRGGVILDALCDKATPDGEFAQPLTALRLLQCQMEYLLRSPNTVLELKFDFISKLDGINNMFGEPFDATAQLIQMFELATKLLPLTSATTPVFTTTVGPLSALWLVAMRAPSTCAALRKRAVRLMLSHPRREGFWDGMIAGQIAQEALRLEYESTVAELGLSSSPDHDLIIPNDLRMISVSVSYVEDDDRKARVEYFNGRDMATSSPGAVQWITW